MQLGAPEIRQEVPTLPALLTLLQERPLQSFSKQEGGIRADARGAAPPMHPTFSADDEDTPMDEAAIHASVFFGAGGSPPECSTTK